MTALLLARPPSRSGFRPKASRPTRRSLRRSRRSSSTRNTSSTTSFAGAPGRRALGPSPSGLPETRSWRCVRSRPSRPSSAARRRARVGPPLACCCAWRAGVRALVSSRLSDASGCAVSWLFPSSSSEGPAGDDANRSRHRYRCGFALTPCRPIPAVKRVVLLLPLQLTRPPRPVWPRPSAGTFRCLVVTKTAWSEMRVGPSREGGGEGDGPQGSSADRYCDHLTNKAMETVGGSS